MRFDEYCSNAKKRPPTCSKSLGHVYGGKLKRVRTAVVCYSDHQLPWIVTIDRTPIRHQIRYLALCNRCRQLSYGARAIRSRTIPGTMILSDVSTGPEPRLTLATARAAMAVLATIDVSQSALNSSQEPAIPSQQSQQPFIMPITTPIHFNRYASSEPSEDSPYRRSETSILPTHSEALDLVSSTTAPSHPQLPPQNA